MLVAIERSQFNYLYKQNSLAADNNRIYWHSQEELLAVQEKALDKAVAELDNILPRFEEDHEILLLQYDPQTWDYNGYGHLEFSGVLSIIPLTAIGKRLLMGRLNEKMKITEPLFSATVEAVKRKRSLRLRRLAAEKLLGLFGLANPAPSAVALIEQAITQLLEAWQPEKRSENIFETLFGYNKTEGFIPEGNVEYLCKIAVLARLHLGQDSSVVPNGPFYKELSNRMSFLNRMGLTEAFQEFDRISSEAIASTQKIKEIVNRSLDFDMFFVAYAFFSFRKQLHQSEYNLTAIKDDLERLKAANSDVASIVLYAIGTIFSFDQLYESIHVLNGAPLVASLSELPSKITEHLVRKPLVIPPDYVHIEQSPTMEENLEQNLNVPVPLVQTTVDRGANSDAGAVDVIRVNETEGRDEQVSKKPEDTLFDAKAFGDKTSGVPVEKFKAFVEGKWKQKGKEISALLNACSNELNQGITLEWLNGKLFLEDAKKRSTLFNESNLKAIRKFFHDNSTNR